MMNKNKFWCWLIWTILGPCLGHSSSFIYLSNLLNEYHNGWKRHSLFEHSFAMAQLKFCEHFSISLNAPFKKYDTFYHKFSDIMFTASLYEALFINKKFCCFSFTWSLREVIFINKTCGLWRFYLINGFVSALILWDISLSCFIFDRMHEWKLINVKLFNTLTSVVVCTWNSRYFHRTLLPS